MIGSRVKKFRKEKRMSISELAEKAGVAKSYISSLERDLQTNPSIQFIEKITRALDISIDSLIQDEPAKGNLDSEWLEIVEEAMKSGVSKEQFKDFIEFYKWRMNH